MLNERGRYSRKGYLVLIDHGSISSALNKFQPFCHAIIQLEGPSNSKTIPSIANYYEEQMEKVYEKELKAFTSIFFENYLIIRRKTDEELLFTCTNSTGMIALDDKGTPTLIKKYGTRMPLDDGEDQGTKTLTNPTPASEIQEPLDPIQVRDEAVLSAMNKMKSATAKLQLDCKLAIDDKLYPDAALDYLLQNKLPLILKEFHFCQALFFSKKSCIPEGYHYSILKRHMARMFDAFIKTVDHLIRVTLSKVYQSQFTAVELILILDKNFNPGELCGTKPTLIKDSYQKVSVDSTYSKRSTDSRQDLRRDSTLSNDLSIHLSGDEEEENLEEDLQNISLKELEPFDFLLDHLKGWKVFLTSQFKQFIVIFLIFEKAKYEVAEI